MGHEGCALDTEMFLSAFNRVAPDTELAGYPAAGYPAMFLLDIRYPAGYPAE